MTEEDTDEVVSFQASVVENGFILTVGYVDDEGESIANFVATDKIALASLIADFIGQMPTPETQQKETRQ